MSQITKFRKATVVNGDNTTTLEKGNANALSAVIQGRPSAKNRFKADIGFISLVAEKEPELLVTVQQYEQLADKQPIMTHEATMEIGNVWTLRQMNPPSNDSPQNELEIESFLNEHRIITVEPEKKSRGMSAQGFMQSLNV